MSPPFGKKTPHFTVLKDLPTPLTPRRNVKEEDANPGWADGLSRRRSGTVELTHMANKTNEKIVKNGENISASVVFFKETYANICVFTCVWSNFCAFCSEPSAVGRLLPSSRRQRCSWRDSAWCPGRRVSNGLLSNRQPLWWIKNDQKKNINQQPEIDKLWFYIEQF